MRVSPHSSQRSTWPPSAAVRQAVIAAITRPPDAPEVSSVRSFVTVAVAVEDVGQFERPPNPHRGGVTCSDSRSRGLSLLATTRVERRV
jgi:hypothetical protein